MKQTYLASSLASLINQNINHYKYHQHLIPQTLPETIKYHYLCAKKNKIFNNTIEFAEVADLSDLTIRRYMNDREPSSLLVVLKIGLALRLSTPYLLDLFTKFDCYKKSITKDNIIFNTIVYFYAQSRYSLEEVYDALSEVGSESFLQMTKRWLEYTNKL